jgi:hypothetical protein
MICGWEALVRLVSGCNKKVVNYIAILWTIGVFDFLASDSALKSGRQPLCFLKEGILTRRIAAILLMLVDSGIRCYIQSIWDMKS